MERDCDNCGKPYTVVMGNFNRGWGKCCSKSCAAQLRSKVSQLDDVQTLVERKYNDSKQHLIGQIAAEYRISVLNIVLKSTKGVSEMEVIDITRQDAPRQIGVIKFEFGWDNSDYLKNEYQVRITFFGNPLVKSGAGIVQAPEIDN